MASSIAAITMPRSIDFSRATASAICSSSSLLALTAMAQSPLIGIGLASARAFRGEAMLLGVLWQRFLGRRFLRRLADGFLRLCGRLGMRCQRWREAEIALHLALGGLAAAHRLGDQLVGQHQLGFADIGH